MVSRNKSIVSIYLSSIKKLTLLLVMILTISSCQKEDDPTPPLMNSAAPAFTLSSVDDGEVKLSDYTGKVVVLFFFGNNCPSCKAVAPNVESMLVDPFSSRTDYQLLGLDQWNGNLASLQAFKASTSVSFPLLLDASDVAKDYKTTYDRLVVIDKEGDIVFSGTQLASVDVITVKQLVEMLLSE